MELRDRVAFITGAGGGIGKEIAIELSKLGALIVLFGGNNKEKLEATANAVSENGGKALVFQGDLTDLTLQSQLFNKAIEKTGKIDILINNAGVAKNCAFENTTIEEFDKIMNINVRVPYALTKTALPYLKKSDRASIINIVSVVSHAGYPMQSAYVASKHALLGFTKSLAAETYQDGIRVHAISPGGVYTYMVKISRPDLTSDGMISPKDIADIVVFLLKNRNNAVIDEILVHRANKQPFLV